MAPTNRRTLRKRPNYTNGLSLIELLIVLGVVILLGALLFPAINSTRTKTQQTNCIIGLQQISHAISLYTADFDGMYPQSVVGNVDNNQTLRSAPVWADTLAGYLHKDLPSCPARQSVHVAGPTELRGDVIGYAINSLLNSQQNSPSSNRRRYIMNGRSENVLRYPNSTISVFDARCGIYEALRPDMAQSQEDIAHCCGHIVDANNQYPFLQQTPGALRHQGGANYAFVDGHVNWLKPTQIAIEPQNDGIRPGFGL